MLQRYRINNCADIEDDSGGYFLVEDVNEEIEYFKGLLRSKDSEIKILNSEISHLKLRR